MLPRIFGAYPILLALLWTLGCRAMDAQNTPIQSPALDRKTQDQVSLMLRDAYNEVKKHYYDPKIHGLDWDARFQQYRDSIGKVSDLGGGMRLVAGFLNELKDSHTYFEPPARASVYEPGYRLELVGDACYIARVRPGTDAESKVHVGDKVVSLNGFNCRRVDFDNIEYVFNTLSPQPSVKFDLRTPAGEQRRVEVKAYSRPLKRILDMTQGDDVTDAIRKDEDEAQVMRSRIAEFPEAAIWKLPEFEIDSEGVQSALGAARKRKTLILDLRGNPGGSVDSLRLMVGSLFDRDVKISDRVGRHEFKPIMAKRFDKPFGGKVIVLVDGGSASASELLARVVQLEHRGVVIGDRTSGAVMEAKYYSDFQGVERGFFYGFSVTDANLIMRDGQSLEKTGVTPDELLVPTGEDLATGSDPVMTRAAQLAGFNLDPVAAGKLFPLKWLPLN